MKLRNILAFVLVIIITVALFAGCSGDAKDNSNSPSKNDASFEENTGDPKKITIFFQDDNIRFPQNMERPNYQKIGKIALEQFNIELQTETAISTEIMSTLNARLASGESMPDIFDVGFTIQRAVELYEQGRILGLSQLIKDYAPEIERRMITENPSLAIAHSTSDGEILRIPSVEESIQHEIYVMHIRYDWLRELGLDVPTTPDEFLDTLIAFRENDMNGDGRQNEIFSPGSFVTFNATLSTAFDVPKLSAANESWWVDEDGKIYNTMVSDNAKDFVEFVQKMGEAGVLDVEYTNTTADAINQKRYNNLVSGITGAWWDSVVLDVQIAEKVPGAEYVPMEPLKSASGDQFILRRNNNGWDPHYLSSTCADPVGCIKLLNWCYTKEGTQILYFGETAPGGDYYMTPTDVPEGITDIDYQLVYTEKGEKAMAEEPELWTKMGWNICAFLPQYFESSVDCIALEFYTSFGTDSCGRAAEVEFNKTTLNKFINDIGRRDISFATPTAEQIEALNNYDDLWTYMEEDFTNFLLGNKSLDEWQSYVDKCYSMGLQKAIYDIFQPRYESYLEILKSMQ